jgi:hypothetical protein
MLKANGSPIPALVGKSAYDFAKDGGYNGNEDDFSKKLNQDINADISSCVKQMLQGIFGVGYIYTSYSATNPADIFGFGKWERIKDRFLLAAGDSYTAGEKGGAATHTLTEPELPMCDGWIEFHGNGTSTVVNAVGGTEGRTMVHARNTTTKYKNGGTEGTTASSVGIVDIRFGGGKPHNNMPPYEVVYAWKRIS